MINENQLKELYERSISTLENNQITWNNKIYQTAGLYQFHSIWTRDVAHCTLALMQLGYESIVRNNIELYLKYVKNGIGPKGFDTMNIEKRVIIQSIRNLFNLKKKNIKFNTSSKLKTIYKDSRRSVAIDSNLLVILSIFDCDYSIINKNYDVIISMIKYYDKFIVDGLIYQNNYSDWQDSQKRKGASFLTNLMYWEVIKRFIMYDFDIYSIEYLNNLENLIKYKFYDNENGLFKTMEKLNNISLDGNLLAIRWKFVKDNEALKLWYNLKKHPLWNNKLGPGYTTYPNYPSSYTTYQVKIANLKNYHNSLYWSWLMALSAEISYIMNDMKEGDKIACRLWKIIRRDIYVGEIYNNNDEYSLYHTILYRSECPFSWGAAYIINMIEVRKTKKILNK